MQRRRIKQKKIILGLTGSFGSGKSTVAGILRSCGAEIIDADKIAHRCYRPQSNAYKKIINLFGRRIMGGDKKINRRKLAGMVFADKGLLKKLNRIVHPQVKAIISSRIRQSKKKAVVIDAPLLIEAGLQRVVDKLIVVTLDRQKQLARMKKRDALSPAEIRKRVRAQIPLQRKAVLADFIIDNSGTREETKRQVKRIWKKII
ncbi:MAG: dephospho-CoA kinase [Candidatus Omnitrophica bacterium]|nr:dephospho-CoA kinase [Candidatus Omnitrophota bacterium]MBL7210403.1 dephospho-CoA kinase [Candidatus Omnitrophota bacterium]